jgi:hypothetical protein
VLKAHLLRVLPDTMVFSVGFSENDSSTVVTFGAAVDTIRNAALVSRTVRWCTVQYMDSRLRVVTGPTTSSLEACKHEQRSSASISSKAPASPPREWLRSTWVPTRTRERFAHRRSPVQGGHAPSALRFARADAARADLHR